GKMCSAQRPETCRKLGKLTRCANETRRNMLYGKVGEGRQRKGPTALRRTAPPGRRPASWREPLPGAIVSEGRGGLPPPAAPAIPGQVDAAVEPEQRIHQVVPIVVGILDIQQVGDGGKADQPHREG